MCSILHPCRSLDCQALFIVEGTSESMLLRCPGFNLNVQHVFTFVAVIVDLTTEPYSRCRVLELKALLADTPGRYTASD